MEKARSGARGQIKSLVLWITVVSVLVFALLVVFRSTAHAEYEAYIHTGTLVIKEIASVTYVANVPVGLTPGRALELVMGRRTEVAIEDKIGKTDYSFSLPWIKSVTEYQDKMAIYDGRQAKPWFVGTMPSRTVLDSERTISCIYLWIPAFFILVMSVGKSLPAIWMKKLLVCYAAIFAGILAGTLAGWITSYDEATRVTIGLVAGLIVGMFAGIFSDGGLSGGIIASILTGSMSGIFSGGQQYRLVLYVSLFLLVVEMLCLLVILLIKFVKIRVPPIRIGGYKKSG